jgi:hypothetical protein
MMSSIENIQNELQREKEDNSEKRVGYTTFMETGIPQEESGNRVKAVLKLSGNDFLVGERCKW